MAKYYFNEKENADWLAKLPKKSIAAKVIIKSDTGNVLLVKPNYKEAWQLPGGGIEAGEEPKEGLLRELKEELGLVADKANLKLLDTVFRQKHDNLILVYEYVVELNENEELHYLQEELDGYKFEDPKKVALQLSDYWQIFCQNYIAA